MMISTTNMFVILMVVIVATNNFQAKILEILVALIFTTLKCAILIKEIVVTIQELVMGFVMTLTITDSAVLMEEIVALGTRILVDVLLANALKCLM